MTTRGDERMSVHTQPPPRSQRWYTVDCEMPLPEETDITRQLSAWFYEGLQLESPSRSRTQHNAPKAMTETAHATSTQSLSDCIDESYFPVLKRASHARAVSSSETHVLAIERNLTDTTIGRSIQSVLKCIFPPEGVISYRDLALNQWTQTASMECIQHHFRVSRRVHNSVEYFLFLNSDQDRTGNTGITGTELTPPRGKIFRTCCLSPKTLSLIEIANHVATRVKRELSLSDEERLAYMSVSFPMYLAAYILNAELLLLNLERIPGVRVQGETFFPDGGAGEGVAESLRDRIKLEQDRLPVEVRECSVKDVLLMQVAKPLSSFRWHWIRRVSSLRERFGHKIQLNSRAASAQET